MVPRLRYLFLPALLLVIAALQYRLWFGEGGLTEASRLESRTEVVRVENATRANRNRVLMAEIKDLKTGLASIEDRARSELGMIRQGETFYLLVDQP